MFNSKKSLKMETKILVETSKIFPKDGVKFWLKVIVRKLANRWREHSLFHYVVL